MPVVVVGFLVSDLDLYFGTYVAISGLIGFMTHVVYIIVEPNLPLRRL